MPGKLAERLSWLRGWLERNERNVVFGTNVLGLLLILGAFVYVFVYIGCLWPNS